MQDSRAVGAIAGLAFAIVFTWRMLRTPSGPQRRQPKRDVPTDSGFNSHESINPSTSGVSNPSEDSRTQNVVDEFFQPVKVYFFSFIFIMYSVSSHSSYYSFIQLQPTLGQIVRQRLSEGRKVIF